MNVPKATTAAAMQDALLVDPKEDLELDLYESQGPVDPFQGMRNTAKMWDIDEYLGILSMEGRGSAIETARDLDYYGKDDEYQVKGEMPDPGMLKLGLAPLLAGKMLTKGSYTILSRAKEAFKDSGVRGVKAEMKAMMPELEDVEDVVSWLKMQSKKHIQNNPIYSHMDRLDNEFTNAILAGLKWLKSPAAREVAAGRARQNVIWNRLLFEEIGIKRPEVPFGQTKVKLTDAEHEAFSEKLEKVAEMYSPTLEKSMYYDPDNQELLFDVTSIDKKQIKKELAIALLGREDIRLSKDTQKLIKKVSDEWSETVQDLVKQSPSTLKEIGQKTHEQKLLKEAVEEGRTGVDDAPSVTEEDISKWLSSPAPFETPPATTSSLHLLEAEGAPYAGVGSFAHSIKDEVGEIPGYGIGPGNDIGTQLDKAADILFDSDFEDESTDLFFAYVDALKAHKKAIQARKKSGSTMNVPNSENVREVSKETLRVWERMFSETSQTFYNPTDLPEGMSKLEYWQTIGAPRTSDVLVDLPADLFPRHTYSADDLSDAERTVSITASEILEVDDYGDLYQFENMQELIDNIGADDILKVGVGNDGVEEALTIDWTTQFI